MPKQIVECFTSARKIFEYRLVGLHSYRRALRWNILTASIAASVLSSGCVNRVLTTAIVKAPNQRDTPYLFSPQGAKQLQKDDRTYSGAWMISVGPPAAELSVATVAPRAYQVTTSIETSKLKSGRFHIWQR